MLSNERTALDTLPSSPSPFSQQILSSRTACRHPAFMPEYRSTSLSVGSLAPFLSEQRTTPAFENTCRKFPRESIWPILTPDSHLCRTVSSIPQPIVNTCVMEVFEFAGPENLPTTLRRCCFGLSRTRSGNAQDSGLLPLDSLHRPSFFVFYFSFPVLSLDCFSLLICYPFISIWL